MYLAKTPAFIQRLFPDYTWRIPTQERVLYLTFDDGPIPEVTPWVLDMLRTYNARATFFCVGENVQRYPEIFDRIIQEGHSVGNHTHQHLNGWNTEPGVYLDNVQQCATFVPGKLFRPPYGRLRPAQAGALKKMYRIILWDVLSGDFDQSIQAEECFQNIIRHSRPGSIVVLHDSLKSERNLRYALPALLEFYTKKGWKFCALDKKTDD